VVGLLRALRAELARGRRGIDAASVYATDVRADQWALAEARLEDSRRRLVAYLSDDEGTQLDLPIRHSGAGDLVTAVEDRGITCFMASREEELADAVGRYLAGHGFLRFASEVEVHAAEVPRAERLEADDIWTHGEAQSLAFPEPEEAHA
jgi:hypothetical protein